MQVEDPEQCRRSAEEQRLRRMNNTPQGGAIDGNPAKRGTDDTLMVDQGSCGCLAQGRPAPFVVWQEGMPLLPAWRIHRIQMDTQLDIKYPFLGGRATGNACRRQIRDTGCEKRAGTGHRFHTGSACLCGSGARGEKKTDDLQSVAQTIRSPFDNPSTPLRTGLRANGGKLKSHGFSVHAES